jgi:hypothetical protein
MPSSPTTSKMSYEVYRNKSSTEEEFHFIADMYERVMREDKVLCVAAQKNLDRGVFVNGQLHPKYEKAPLFFQNTVRQVIAEHYQKETREGKEIWPAKQTMRENAKMSDIDEDLCKGIECASGGQKVALAW